LPRDIAWESWSVEEEEEEEAEEKGAELTKLKSRTVTSL
jgi:hypothetical protein